MDIFSPTIIDNAIITGSNNASLLQVSSPSAASAFFISGSGRVGIGTTSPLSTLTVEGGNINIGAGRGIGGNFVGTYTSFITYHSDGLGFLQSASFGFRGSAYMDSIAYPDLFGFGTNDLRFFTSTNGIAAPSEIVRMVGSTGFVGIGETSPSAKLEIRGSGATSATTALRVENSNTSASLVVTNDIRVGINKTTPNSELDVNGNTIITGSITSTSNITTLGSVVTPSQTISVGNGWGNSSGTTNLLNIAGNLVPTATAIINSLAITSTVSQSVNPTTIIRGILVSPTFNTLGPQYRAFEWNNNQGFGLYGVGAAPNYLSGSLGIGTTSPSASLHISGASNSNLLRVGSPTSDNILFVTGSGRVGVGTTTPRELLHVGGGNLSLDSTRYIDFGNGNSRINDLGLVSGQGYSLRITTFGPIGTGTANSLTEKLRLTGSGSLGLGTDSPSARFHISGGFTDGNLMRVQSPTGAEYFFISASGNVGIGTGTPTNTLQVVGGITATSITASIISASIGITGSLFGTSSWAVNALTASFVTTLNQNVLVTGSLTIGATSLGANENTLVIGPAPAGGTGEGGQILLQSPGGIYTSASMWDNYQNLTRLLRGTNAGSDAVVSTFNMHTKQMQLPAYNSTTAFVGTVAGVLGFDSSGNILTTTTSGASPAFPFTGSAQITGSLGVTGSISSTAAITSTANNQMYFRGGDDAEFWDINIANTVGIYGQQNAGVASIKLGSGGGTISGQSSSIGINTTSPTARLHISGASADSLLRVGSPTQANTLFITGSNRVGIGTGTPRALFEVNDKIIAEAGGNVGIQTTADYWIHLSTDPGGGKHLNIDAAQSGNPPADYTPSGGNTMNKVVGNISDGNVLGTPDYWMEIRLGGTTVLIPCYTPTP